MIQKSAMKLAKNIINITYQIMASIIISLSLSLVTLIVTAVSFAHVKYNGNRTTGSFIFSGVVFLR